jgi:hypothetical protein
MTCHFENDNTQMNLTDAIQSLHIYKKKVITTKVFKGFESSKIIYISDKNVEKTPVTLLHEMCNKTQTLPIFETTVEEIETRIIFKSKVTAFGDFASGEGHSKMEAKHKAAVALLHKINTKGSEEKSRTIKELTLNQVVEPPLTSNQNAELPSNLNRNLELCLKIEQLL